MHEARDAVRADSFIASAESSRPKKKSKSSLAWPTSKSCLSFEKEKEKKKKERENATDPGIFFVVFFYLDRRVSMSVSAN